MWKRKCTKKISFKLITVDQCFRENSESCNNIPVLLVISFDAHKLLIELVESKRVLKEELDGIKGKSEDQKKNYEKQLKEMKEQLEQADEKKDKERELQRREGGSVANLALSQKLEEELKQTKAKLDDKNKKAKELKEEKVKTAHIRNDRDVFIINVQKERLEDELESLKKKNKRQNSIITEFEETKDKFEKSVAELNNKLKQESQKSADLLEKSEIFTRENEQLKLKVF